MTAGFRLGARLAAGFLMLAVPVAAGAACSVTPQSVSFGSYDPLGASALDGVGSINVSCDAVTMMTVSLSSGAGTFADRRMNGGATQLSYNLYTDTSRVTVWGDGVGGGSTVSANSSNVDLTVYGRIPASQNVPANVYTDTITVTVTY